MANATVHTILKERTVKSVKQTTMTDHGSQQHQMTPMNAEVSQDQFFSLLPICL